MATSVQFVAHLGEPPVTEPHNAPCLPTVDAALREVARGGSRGVVELAVLGLNDSAGTDVRLVDLVEFWPTPQQQIVWFQQPRNVQGRLADLSGAQAVYAPVPTVDMLYNRNHQPGDSTPVHHIHPTTVPPSGLRLERRYVLGRRTDGTPVLWSERRRAPLSAPHALPLHFDILDPAPSASEQPN